MSEPISSNPTSVQKPPADGYLNEPESISAWLIRLVKGILVGIGFMVWAYRRAGKDLPTLIDRMK